MLLQTIKMRYIYRRYVCQNMSIKVNKYEANDFDAKTSEALESVVSTLKKQVEHVKEVTFFSNFSIDKSNTLKYGQLVTKGLVVQVSPNYVMSGADMSWFHPNIGSGRSLYSVDKSLSKSALQSVVFENDDSSIGEYLTTTPDEFGSSEVSHHVIIRIF
jgi:hypothetical protein